MSKSEEKEPRQEAARGKSAIALREEETLRFWQEHQIFQKSVEKEAPNGEFVFYDGPPFATGSKRAGRHTSSQIFAGPVSPSLSPLNDWQARSTPSETDNRNPGRDRRRSL